MERIRVLRVLEYVGDRDWVEDTLKRSIQGILEVPSKYDKTQKNCIKSCIVDGFPEILDKGKVINKCQS